MADELPENADSPDASADAVEGTSVRKRRFPLMWVILVPILIAAAGMLASDIFRGRNPQARAFERINDKLKQQQSNDPEDTGGGMGGRRDGDAAPPLTVERVHDLLGREPDSVAKKNGNLNGQADSNVQMEPIIVETYKFPGIITTYDVIVTYLEVAAVENRPATTALISVRKK